MSPSFNRTGLAKYSSTVTQPKSQGGSQAMLYATGLSDADMDKPQVGIVSMWLEGNPCNLHLLRLSREREGGGARRRNGGDAV